MLRYQHVHTLGTTSTSAQWRRGLHPTTTPWCVLRYSMCHVRSTMFLNSNSFHKFLKSHLLSRCACFQNVWHPLIIYTHDLLCSSPHGDIRIVIWPIIVLKFSYGLHQICHTPFRVIHICCFFHDSRPPYAKSVAFKIHSIEIEDPSHNWLPVVYLHVDTKGQLLSRRIAEKSW